MKRIIFVAFVALALTTGCKKDVIMTETRVTTLDVESLSAACVVMKGMASYSKIGPSKYVGFQYSTSADFTDSKEGEGFYDGHDYFTRRFPGLTPSTRYYYRAFVCQHDRYTYGETREFTTLPVSTLVETLDYTNEKEYYVTLKGKVCLTNTWFSIVEYGFYVGASEGEMEKIISYSGYPPAEGYSWLCPDNYNSGQFYYKAFVRLDDVTYYGEMKHYQ